MKESSRPSDRGIQFAADARANLVRRDPQLYSSIFSDKMTASNALMSEN
jgi:hypothetical protein